VGEALEYVLVTLLSREAERYKESLFGEWEQQFDDMKQEIVRISHEKENELLNSQEEESESGTKEEPSKSAEAVANGGDQKKQGTRTTKTANSKAAAVPKVVPLRFVVHAGYHTGQTFHLQCAAAKPCFVGRSKQAKYKKNGLSLHLDLEMSTAHAQIGLDPDTFQPYIVDTGCVRVR
jgi:TolA-binding protein